MKRPAFQFYPADWRKDSALQSCSGTARGLWIEMMCVMHECEPYGHLSINGNTLTDPQAARMVGFALPEYRRALTELDAAGVFSRSASGVIYCRRMVKDEGVREVRAAGGILGAEHGQKGAEHGVKGGRPTTKQPPLKPPLDGVDKPPPSSSSSSSSSKAAKPNPPALPDGLPVSPELWSAFREVRRNMKAKQTEYAEGLLVKELDRLRGQGHDPTAVVEQSIRSNWKDVFPIKRKVSGELSLAERRAANMAETMGRNRERTVTDSMGGAPVLAPLSYVREQDDGDVGRLPEG